MGGAELLLGAVAELEEGLLAARQVHRHRVHLQWSRLRAELEPQLEPHRLEPVVHHAALHGEVVVELVAGVARHVARRVLDGLLTEVRARY